MPGREEPFIDGECYHIFNRGVAKLPIFLKPAHYLHFESSANYYLTKKPGIRFSKYLRLSQSSQLEKLTELKTKEKLVEVIAYCCMPNHFHFLIKQLSEGGISHFMQLLLSAYTRYFNTVSHPTRVGPVFQGHFKAVRIRSEQQLLHSTRYIHLNPCMANLISKNELELYPYSSYPEFVTANHNGRIFINPSPVLEQFKNSNTYRKFCLDYTDYGFTLSAIKHALIDGDD